MTDPIQQIEDRYGKGKPSVGLPQIFMDIRFLIALVKAYEEYVWMYADLNDQNADELKDKIKKQIFEKEVKQ